MKTQVAGSKPMKLWDFLHVIYSIDVINVFLRFLFRPRFLTFLTVFFTFLFKKRCQLQGICKKSNEKYS